MDTPRRSRAKSLVQSAAGAAILGGAAYFVTRSLETTALIMVLLYGLRLLLALLLAQAPAASRDMGHHQSAPGAIPDEGESDAVGAGECAVHAWPLKAGQPVSR